MNLCFLSIISTFIVTKVDFRSFDVSRLLNRALESWTWFCSRLEKGLRLPGCRSDGPLLTCTPMFSWLLRLTFGAPP